jgi:hypothetical protein
MVDVSMLDDNLDAAPCRGCGHDYVFEVGKDTGYCRGCTRRAMTSPFVIPLRAEPWPHAAHPKRPCAVCGELWWPWVGSYLPCHGRCLFTDEARAAIIADPRTENEIALDLDLGVTVSVVRGVRRAAERRERKAAAPW